MILFVIMLFKNARLLSFFSLVALSSLALFLTRIIEARNIGSAFIDSFGFISIGMLIFLGIYLFRRFNINRTEDNPDQLK